LYEPGSYLLFAALPFGLGVPLAAAAGIGVAVALRRRTLADVVCLPYLLVTLVALATAPVPFVRYVLPVVPFLALVAARALMDLLGSGRQWVRTVGFAALVLVLGYSGIYASQSVVRLTADARAQAEGQLTELIPPGASVTETEFANYYPSLDPSLYQIVACPEGTHDPGRLAACGADYLITSGMLINRALRDPARYATAYRNVQALREGRLGYVRIARFHDTYLHQGLYTALDPMFEGYFVSPTIEIYRRVPSGGSHGQHA
jgi:hypothetical protein